MHLAVLLFLDPHPVYYQNIDHDLHQWCQHISIRSMNHQCDILFLMEPLIYMQYSVCIYFLIEQKVGRLNFYAGLLSDTDLRQGEALGLVDMAQKLFTDLTEAHGIRYLNLQRNTHRQTFGLMAEYLLLWK